jgi:hypothetical protein
MAPTKRSPGSALSLCCDFQRRISTKAPRASTALSTKTQALEVAARMAPATTGPTIRDRFIATPLSASACGMCTRGTISGTMAANTGQRSARPMPLVKVSRISSSAVSASASDSTASTTALSATQSCVPAK